MSQRFWRLATVGLASVLIATGISTIVYVSTRPAPPPPPQGYVPAIVRPRPSPALAGPHEKCPPPELAPYCSQSDGRLLSWDKGVPRPASWTPRPGIDVDDAIRRFETKD